MYSPLPAPRPGAFRRTRVFPRIRRRWRGLPCLLLVLALLLPRTGAAALPADSLRLDLDRDLAEQLIPLEDIQRLAERFSPALREEGMIAEGKLRNIDLHRRSFLSTVSVTGSAIWGNSTLVSTGSNSFDFNQFINGYRGGMQMMIPLEVFANRRNRIRLAQADHRMSLARIEVAKQNLRREVSKVYYELLTAQRLLKVYLEDEQAALVAFRSAELDWQNGRATVQEYSAASRSYTDIRVKVENARGGFVATLVDLTLLTGADVQELKRP